MATVASYFDINTAFVERKTEIVAQSISRSFFRLSNLIGVNFSDYFIKSIKVPDTDSHPVDVTYSNFHYNVFANTVDCRAPKNR